MNVAVSGTQYYWLDPVAQWRGSWQGLAERPGDQSLVLAPLPAADRQLFTKLGTSGPCVGSEPWQCPVAIAADPCHGLFVIDGATGKVFHADVATESAHELLSVGGIGTGARQFSGVRGAAILSDGSLAVLDAKAKRVAVFSPDPYALIALFSTGAASQPSGLAAASGDRLLVADAGQKKVLVFDREGGSLPAMGEGLTAPTAVATFTGMVAVLDGSAVVVFPSSGGMNRVALPAGFRYEGLAFDEYGNLNVAALPNKGAEGSVASVEVQNGVPVFVGFGPLGIEGRATALVGLAGTGLLAVIYNATSRRSTVWRIDPLGACVAQGVFTSDVLDSNIDRCAWHRVVCEGTVPPGTSISLETVTGATAADCIWKAAAAKLTIPGDASISDPDFLVQSGPGRFIRFRLTLTSSVPSSPVVTGIRVEFPRRSYLQYLPAVYQEDPDSRSFQDRFLSLFQSYFDDLNERIDGFPMLFDPASVPAAYLGWLAAIVAMPLDPTWTLDKKRQILAGLFHYDPATSFVTGKYPARGTPAQVSQDIGDYSGVDGVSVLEHYRLRSWLSDSGKLPLDEGTRLWSRDIYQRLQVAVYSRLGYFRLLEEPEPALEPLAWGAHRFSVFFPAHPYTVEDTRQKIAQAVELAKPAHTQAVLCPVLPRFRVGYQSTVEVDTVLGEVHQMILDRLATLDYDAVLSGPPALDPLIAAQVNETPRTGITTRLL